MSARGPKPAALRKLPLSSRTSPPETVISNEPGRVIGLPRDTRATVKIIIAVRAGFVLETRQMSDQRKIGQSAVFLL
jgi:hypothetical protein